MTLPKYLEERVDGDGEPTDGEFVLYWLRTAQRAHENPALDVAISVGNALGKPVFVYHALSERYPYASDRHHTFILEGARDLQPRLRARGVATAFHLERPGHRGPHLKTLADRACLVVTEDMPVPPLTRWTAALAASTQTPVWRVDTACVVPMNLVGKVHTRAYPFRKAIQPLVDDRILRPWTDVIPTVPAPSIALPFEPVNLADADIADLVGACEIDHSVGPIAHTRGGSGPGYARWRAYRDGGLKRYSKTRNNPLIDGVSRMSAYLHYGMVSPLTVAREAEEMGADKYVDELITWREVAHSFCKFGPDPHRLSAIPHWARATLERHEGDERTVLDWETLARGRTGDALWDVAQKSLLMRGELHNNVRMTWGKAIIGWSRDGQQALDRLLDLNHRYALDGRDPASYGGLLWALGQFDRPFTPENPILGEIRGRGTAHHAGRLDVAAWAQKVNTSAFVNPPRIAVIGAGVAGAACARTLVDAGLDVVLVDAAERVGGRLGGADLDGVRVDAGALHMTVRDPMVQRWVDAWVDAGVVGEWTGVFGTLTDGKVVPTHGLATRYIGVPRMAAVAARLCQGVTVQLNQPVSSISDDGVLGGAEALGRFGAVCLAVEPGNPLLDGHAPTATTEAVTAISFTLPMASTWSFAEARLPDGPVERVVRDSTRAGRPTGERWLCASRPGFDGEPEVLLAAVLAAFDLSEPIAWTHRSWRVGKAQVDAPAISSWDGRIGVCGSALNPGRVENALTSGVDLAGRILRSLAKPNTALFMASNG
jgi:photolyase PhrII